MNARRSTLTLAVAAISLGIAQEASAYYAAHMGRFTSRDPAGQPHVSQVVEPLLEVEMARGRFADRDKAQIPKPDHPYHDGMNIYQYVGGMPQVAVDPLGLKRDLLDCVADCLRQRAVSNAGTGAFHTGNAAGNHFYGRYPRSGIGGPRPGGGVGAAGSPSTWQHKACMRTKLSGAGAVAGKACVFWTLCEGYLDIGAEIYCTATCVGDPSQEDF